MGSGRLEAFSDGVIAILITIMVLELKVPHGEDPALLLALWPVFVSYLLSFIVIAIYWVNHHRLFHLCKHVNTPILWSNIFWLFCISLLPFTTAYVAESHFTPFATALYATSLLLAGLAYVPLRFTVASQFKGTPAYERDWRRAARKNYISVAIYVAAIPLAYVHPAITMALAFVVAAIYFVPNAWLGEKQTRSAPRRH